MAVGRSNDVNNETDFSFAAEEMAALRIAFIGRLVALVLIAGLTTILTPWPGPLYLYVLLSLFALLGFANYRLAVSKWRKPWHLYAFVTADFALLTFTLIYPNPFVLTEYPPQIGMRFGNFVYFFVLLAGFAYLYRPGLVIWGGISAGACWFVGVVWLLNQPGAVWRNVDGDDVESFIGLLGEPGFIDLGVRVQEVMVLLITAGLLALLVKRAREIALQQANLASERTNLARYFPRKTVAILASKGDFLSEPREHEAAVMFVDVVSFTGWAERRTPRATINILRDVHALLAEAVFDHDGTLDKFIGDGVMASFGTPDPSNRDATDALLCAIDMADRFETWRKSRKKGNGNRMRLAIGVHYGPIVLGDIGTRNRMEFALLGNTVNVASRLEGANREFESRCLVSEDLVAAALKENPQEVNAAVERLEILDPIVLRGQTSPTAIRGLM